MEIQVDTTQIDALKEFFNNLSTSDQRKIFLTAFRKASKPMINEAKTTAPRRTGNLARSIGTIGLPNEVAILVGAKVANKGWHGHLIENGTANRFRRTKGNAPTGRVIGIHFFENAYNNNESYMVNSVEEEWLKAIDNYIIKFNNTK